MINDKTKISEHIDTSHQNQLLCVDAYQAVRGKTDFQEKQAFNRETSGNIARSQHDSHNIFLCIYLDVLHHPKSNSPITNKI